MKKVFGKLKEYKFLMGIFSKNMSKMEKMAVVTVTQHIL
jgi:hypothetical protein